MARTITIIRSTVIAGRGVVDAGDVLTDVNDRDAALLISIGRAVAGDATAPAEKEKKRGRPKGS